MDKKLKMALIGAPLLIGGYFIYKQIGGKKLHRDAVDEGDCCKMNPMPNDCTGCQGGDPNATTNEPQAVGYQKYIVNTLISPLNVRNSPSLSATIIEKLDKGEEIFAKPSLNDGWFEVSRDGLKSLGFSSSSFLKKA